MIKSEPKDLIKALTRTCMTALEAGVGRCVADRQYEVTIDHFLLGLLADRGSDFSMLVALHGFEPGAVERTLEEGCADQRTGNPGRPTFSVSLLQLFEDALHEVTVPGKAAKIRSAALVGELVRDPSRYEARPFAERLRQLPSHGPLSAMPLGDLAREARESAGAALEAPVPKRPRTALIHRVVEGEDLLAIARRYALDVEDVARANHVGITAALTVGSTLELRVLSELVWPEPTPGRGAEVIPIRRPD